MQPRLGIVLPLGDTAPRSDVIEFAQRVEELGYDSIWVGESWGRDSITVLTQIACHTTKLKLGTGIVTVYSRSPGLVAQTAASLDDISGGRVLLGLGVSAPKVIRDWHGVSFEKPLQRTKEYIEIINLALSGERVNYEGEFFQLKDFRMSFRGPRNHIPIYIAAMGQKNIELVGESADGWLPILFNPGFVQEFKEDIRTGAQKSGRDSEVIELAPYVMTCISQGDDSAKNLVRNHIAFYVGGAGTYYNNLVRRYGFVEEANKMKELWVEKRDREGAAGVVSETMLDSLAIVGNDPKKARERLLEIQAQGVQAPIAFLPPGATQEHIRETIETLAPKSFS